MFILKIDVLVTSHPHQKFELCQWSDIDTVNNRLVFPWQKGISTHHVKKRSSVLKCYQLFSTKMYDQYHQYHRRVCLKTLLLWSHIMVNEDNQIQQHLCRAVCLQAFLIPCNTYICGFLSCWSMRNIAEEVHKLSRIRQTTCSRSDQENFLTSGLHHTNM
jgi:hypothetical protein